MGRRSKDKQDIAARFGERHQAQRYRDRFLTGRRQRTHAREAAALTLVLDTVERLAMVVDVASGAGRFVPVFAGHAERLVQVDYSEHMLAISREDHPGSLCVRADARGLPLADGCADLVFCHRLLNHLPAEADRLAIMGHLARISRNLVVVSCLTPLSILRTLRKFRARLRGKDPVDGFLDAGDLIVAAERVGLRLSRRARIRSFPLVGEFLVFTHS